MFIMLEIFFKNLWGKAISGANWLRWTRASKSPFFLKRVLYGSISPTEPIPTEKKGYRSLVLNALRSNLPFGIKRLIILKARHEASRERFITIIFLLISEHDMAKVPEAEREFLTEQLEWICQGKGLSIEVNAALLCLEFIESEGGYKLSLQYFEYLFGRCKIELRALELLDNSHYLKVFDFYNRNLANLDIPLRKAFLRTMKDRKCHVNPIEPLELALAQLRAEAVAR